MRNRTKCNSSSGQIAFAKQARDIAQSPAHPWAWTALTAQQNRAQCAVGAGGFVGAVGAGGFDKAIHVLCNKTGCNPHSELAAFAQRVRDIAHSPAPWLARAILAHNRTKSKAPSERAAFAKQFRDITRPLAHVLHNGIRHCPHTEQAASAK